MRSHRPWPTPQHLAIAIAMLATPVGCSEPAKPSDPPPPEEPQSATQTSSALVAPSASPTEESMPGDHPSADYIVVGILALRHRRFFEAYDFLHTGEDGYDGLRPLRLVSPRPPAAESRHLTCRDFLAPTKREACATHESLPAETPWNNRADLPADLVPESEAGRTAALDVLCIDLKLRVDPPPGTRAFGRDHPEPLWTRIDPRRPYVAIVVTHDPPHVRPIATKPWPSLCEPVWEAASSKPPDVKHMPKGAWWLIWYQRDTSIPEPEWPPKP